MRIVKFKDGTYGVAKYYWIWTKFLDTNDTRMYPLWHSRDLTDNIRKFCKYKTFAEALLAKKTWERTLSEYNSALEYSTVNDKNQPNIRK